jgi:ABC-type uncharacterized transport system auxiliary subunit
MTSKPVRAAALLTVALMLAGCSGLRSDASSPLVYQLRAAAPAANATPALRYEVALRIERAAARPGYDTDRILVLRPGLQLDFYAGSRWPGALPDVVTALIQDTLRASGSYLAVNDGAAALQSDYALRVSIRRFESDYSSGDGAPRVQVAFDCTVGRRSDRAIVATFTAEATAAAAADRMAAVVAAFDAATSDALRSIEAQTLTAIAADTRTP